MAPRKPKLSRLARRTMDEAAKDALRKEKDYQLSQLARRTGRPTAFERRIGFIMTPADRQMGHADALARKRDVAGLRMMVKDQSLESAARIRAKMLLEGVEFLVRTQGRRLPPEPLQVAERKWGEINKEIGPLTRKMQRHEKLTPQEEAEYKRLSERLRKEVYPFYR